MRKSIAPESWGSRGMCLFKVESFMLVLKLLGFYPSILDEKPNSE